VVGVELQQLAPRVERLLERAAALVAQAAVVLERGDPVGALLGPLQPQLGELGEAGPVAAIGRETCRERWPKTV
jgi:hypothetical protein